MECHSWTLSVSGKCRLVTQIILYFFWVLSFFQDLLIIYYIYNCSRPVVIVQGYDNSLSKTDIEKVLTTHFSACGKVTEIMVHKRFVHSLILLLKAKQMLKLRRTLCFCFDFFFLLTDQVQLPCLFMENVRKKRYWILMAATLEKTKYLLSFLMRGKYTVYTVVLVVPVLIVGT